MRCSLKMGRIPPWAWAVTYVFILIPLFAGIYTWALGDQFYHSTAKYEPSLDKDAQDAIAALEGLIRENFRKGHGGNIAEWDGWTIETTSLRVTYLRPTDDQMTFGMTFEIRSESRGGVMGGWSFEGSYPIGGRGDLVMFTEPVVIYKQLLFTPDSLATPLGKSIDYQILFPPPENFYAPVLPLSREVNAKLNGFWEATQGRPHEVSGQCWRMLYLSAITITTVGYGDIVPLTQGARIAVATEAILGIVVIGAFLNSVFQRRASGRWREH